MCINKVDLLEDDKDKELEKMKTKISEFFNNRKIEIIEYFFTCGEIIEGFEDDNNRVAEMILEITTKQ